MADAGFECNASKDLLNYEKHGVRFEVARAAFLDPQRIIAIDEKHSIRELRHYCIGRVQSSILTVRFTYRKQIIRIFGAGYWRQGKVLYEKINNIQAK